MMKLILQKLISKEDLSKEEIFAVMEITLSGENAMQVGAFLVLMESKGATTSELTWILEALGSKSLKVHYPKPVFDIVGTGGDTANTFNISTGSAILAAACGLKVAKHGNRSVSSQCGSADVLEEMGINLNLSPKGIEKCLDEVGIAFMYAPIFHPAMKAVKQVRQDLKVRTFFNFLGPLLNPAGAKNMIVGVYDLSVIDLVAKSLFEAKKNAFVVCSPGVDEITPASAAQVRIVDSKGVHPKEIDPVKLGIERCTLKDLEGKDRSYNAKRLEETLNGGASPWADTLILNAGCALYISKEVKTIQEGIEKARQVHKEGLGYQKLKEWAQCSQACKE